MIDSHAHLTNSPLFDEVDAIIERASKATVEAIVNICTNKESLEKGLALAKRYPHIYNTAATTPHDVELEGASFFPMVEAHVKDLVAIGETGLDYFYEHSPKYLQQEFLSRYFELAIRSQLPLVFHCRDAFQDLFSMADGQYRDRPAVLHCFTGSVEEAKGVLDRGWYISFSGIITFKKSELLREAVRYVPLDRMFVETDAPYLAPQSHRGKQNEPSFLKETLTQIATLKDVSFQEAERMTKKNVIQFFSLKAKM